MTAKAARHELADHPVHGAPTTLPRVLLCAATERWCGRHWTANTTTEHAEYAKLREAHELICSGRSWPLPPGVQISHR